MGRRKNEGAAHLVDHVLPEGIPIRQWVVTLPHPLRYPLAFDGWHLSRVLRLNPHFHTLFLDGVYLPGPAQRRAQVRLAQGTATGPEPKGYLCAQDGSFNLHAARRVAPNDRQGREMLCRYILRPPLANDRLHLSEDGDLTLEFKRPWKDCTRSIALKPKALLARLSSIVPPPRQHVILYFGVLSVHSQWRSQVVPRPKEELKLIALVKSETTIRTLLAAMHLPPVASTGQGRRREHPWGRLEELEKSASNYQCSARQGCRPFKWRSFVVLG